jgi:DNA-binding MarR family transcriptional regulator
VLTEADRTTLEFLAEHRIARVNQIATLLDVTADAAGRRLRRLRASGYVSSQKLYGDQQRHFSITRTGLDVTASRLPVPTVDPMEYRHDIGLGWLWLAARAGAFGKLDAIHPERQMRSADRRADAGPPAERFGLRAIGSGPNGGVLTHYPDLLLETASGHRVAVELELTAKGPRRLENILRRYLADRRIDAVLYLVDDPLLARHVESAAARVGASDLVHVQWARYTEPAGRSGQRTIMRSIDRPRTPELTR